IIRGSCAAGRSGVRSAEVRKFCVVIRVISSSPPEHRARAPRGGSPPTTESGEASSLSSRPPWPCSSNPCRNGEELTTWRTTNPGVAFIPRGGRLGHAGLGDNTVYLSSSHHYAGSERWVGWG